MKKRNVVKQMLSVILSAAMLLPGMAGMASGRETERPCDAPVQYRMASGTGRTQVNFNGGWKFIRSDVTGAERMDYDDSAWVNIGLPHNFSIPYEMTAQFYVGYGWYRREFEVPEEWKDKRVELEFEGVFQVAEVYVNGAAVGTHEGGYSGFVYDITDYLHSGKNLVAVRVNNIWQHDLAPRGGDHQFTGGIYRDVYLNVTEDVHVAWYGTYVTTPDLTNPGFDESAENIDFSQFPTEEEIMGNIRARHSNVRVQTEVVNASEIPEEVQVLHKVKDEDGKTVAEFFSEKREIAAGKTAVIDAVSGKIENIELWSPDHPYLYTVDTSVISGGIETDTFASTFGFRWAQYKTDGFYLNGEKVLLDGANAHQDHAGFADAVSDAGYYRDVAMIKECGMNFIRGSHYPHDPSYTQACDELGVMFWSECNFWGMGGCAGKDGDAVMTANDWFKDAYPQNEADEAAFEQSCLDSLEAMIRVNRNHPSVINWSMGNEVFFTSSKTQDKAKALVNKMRNKAHALDPTRKAGMGGCQREGYDRLEVCDIAGYNGDGGKFKNTEMPNIVAEYGSKTQDRPGEYRPYYDQIQGSDTESYVLQEGSAGLSLWCAFHHGTIGGDGLAKMGIIDYYRLPLDSWYWYREKNTGKEREASVSGTAAGMKLEASDQVMTNDGKKDTKITVTMLDADGNWVNDTRKVTLSVKEGAGIFPGGKSYTFLPDKSIRDGKAAIEFRSYYQGTTIITASAEGLPDAELTLRTEDVLGTGEEEEPENFYDASLWGTVTEKIEEPLWYGASNAASGRPVFPSSNKLEGELAADGDPKTSWTAENTGSGEYFELDLEFSLYLYKIALEFAQEPYPYKIEVSQNKESGWTEAVSYTKDTIGKRKKEESLDGQEARYVRVTFTDVPEDQRAFLSEIRVYGNTASQAPQYVAEGEYLSDIVDFSRNVVTGWGTAGKNQSCEKNPLQVGGVTYEKGIGLHAGSSVIYEAEGRYSRITGVAGIDNEVNGGNAIFRIYGDNKLIYEKELSGGEADAFDLSISGVGQLRLETDANGTDSEDHTDWADVKLFGAVRDISEQDQAIQAGYTAMQKELRAGEEWQGTVMLENAGSSRTVHVGMGLYDGEGSLKDYTAKTVTVGEKKSKKADLSLNLPEDLAGYEGKLFVWDERDMERITKTVWTGVDPAFETGTSEETVQWNTKIDGEDTALVKTGTWKLWKASDAYEGSETYTETAGSTLAWEFEGNYVRIGAKVDGSQAGGTVSVDGKEAQSFSTTAPTSSYNSYDLVWTSEKLPDGKHVVTVTSTGKLGVDYLEAGVSLQSGREENAGEAQLLEVMAEALALIEMDVVKGCTSESRQAAAAAFKNSYTAYEGRKEGNYALAVAALSGALGNLEQEEKTDKAELQKNFDQMKALKEGGRTFTEKSWSVMAAALQEAERILADENASQEEVDGAVEALLAAYRQLEDFVQKTEPPTTEKPDANAEQIKKRVKEFKRSKVTIKSVKSPKKKQLKVIWKQLKGADGYEISYAQNAWFKKAKKVVVKGSTRKKTVKKLKSRKRYYVRIRAYKIFEGEKVYTKYSLKKKVRIK